MIETVVMAWRGRVSLVLREWWRATYLRRENVILLLPAILQRAQMPKQLPGSIKEANWNPSTVKSDMKSVTALSSRCR